MKPMNLSISLIYFGIPTLLLLIATHYYIPVFHKLTGTPLIMRWYTGGLFLLFLPLFIASLILFKKEKKKIAVSFIERFRLQRPDKKVIGLAATGVILTFLLTYLFIEAGRLISPGFVPQPSFMHMEPLKEGELWILAAWLPLFVFNILGEAFYWRGYIFPRQSLSFGKYTWLVHGSLWWLFHIPMGLNLLFTLIPVIFISTWIVQKTKSTWADIIIHGAVNGVGFIMVAFGLVS